MYIISLSFFFVLLPLFYGLLKSKTFNDETMVTLSTLAVLNFISCLVVTVLATKDIFWLSKHFLEPKAYLYVGILATVSFGLLLIIFKLLNKNYQLSWQLKQPKLKKMPYGSAILAASLVGLGVFLLLSSKWLNQNFNLLTPEQIVYNVIQPNEGVDTNFVKSYIFGPLVISVVVFAIIAVVLSQLKQVTFSRQQNKQHDLNRWLTLPGFLAFVILTGIAASQLNAVGFYRYFTSGNSHYIQNNYVTPQQRHLTFPKKKRNLIYIYCESLESTSISKALGGQMATNLLPELTKLASQGIHFSDSQKQFGGAQQVIGTQWTIAAMIAQTSGLPLKVSMSEIGALHQEQSALLPGATTINDILDQAGYQQTLLLGSDATFGGRRAYFKAHGDVKIDDYVAAKKDGRLPDDYKVWWGYEDSKLFDYAKADLTKMSQSQQPFNLTMLTANTHHIGGYAEKQMPHQYQKQYSNVIAYSDQQIASFVKWVQQQPFYDNTTIIISGDHLGMDADYFKKMKNRHTFNLILNAPVDQKAVRTKNRQFSTMDLFPTTLAALGVQIKGNRLGLGTNLLSQQKTLIERDGFKRVNDELTSRSDYYIQQFIQH